MVQPQWERSIPQSISGLIILPNAGHLQKTQGIHFFLKFTIFSDTSYFHSMSLPEAPVVFVPSVELFKAALTQSYLLVPLTKKAGRATEIVEKVSGMCSVAYQ